MTQAATPEHEPDAPARSASPAAARRATLLGVVVALAAALYLLGSHVSWIRQPFSASLGGVTSASYYGYAARAFEEHGVMALRASPAMFFLPTTTEAFVPYFNHPPFPHAITYGSYRLFGGDERALRLPILVLMASVIVGVFAFVRSLGASNTWAATALVAAVPLFFEYGNMVDAPMFSTALLVPIVIAWMRWRVAPSASRYAVFFVFALLGALADWFDYLVVLALWVDVFFDTHARGIGARLKLAFLAGFPVGVGLIAYLLWLVWALGGPVHALHEFRALMAVPMGKDPIIAARTIEYFPNMRTWFTRGVGLPLLIAFAIGVLARAVAVARNGMKTFDRGFLILVIGGALPSVVFWSRAGEHEFWILTLMPAIAVGAAAGVESIARATARLVARDDRRATVCTIVAAVLVGALAFDGARRGVALHTLFRTDVYVTRANALNEVLKEDDVVFMPEDEDQVRYYSHAAVVAPIGHSLENLKATLSHVAPARDHIGRVFLAMPTFHLDRAGWALALRPIIKNTHEIPWGEFRLALTELDKDGRVPIGRDEVRASRALRAPPAPLTAMEKSRRCDAEAASHTTAVHFFRNMKWTTAARLRRSVLDRCRVPRRCAARPAALFLHWMPAVERRGVARHCGGPRRRGRIGRGVTSRRCTRTSSSSRRRGGCHRS